jgi:2-methylcitrate dehydratase PrpD
MARLRPRIRITGSARLSAAYPARWGGAVRVTTGDGRTLEREVRSARGDPEHRLDWEALETKAALLHARQGRSPAGLTELADWCRGLAVPGAVVRPPSAAALGATAPGR